MPHHTRVKANAITSRRLAFQPIPGVSSSHREASLPRYSRVHAVKADTGEGYDLFCWIDAPEGSAPDYVRYSAPAVEFIRGASHDA